MNNNARPRGHRQSSRSFAPACCLARPGSRKRAFHRGGAKLRGAATSQTYFRSCALRTSAFSLFIFDDSYTLWRRPPSFSTTVCAHGVARLPFRRQFRNFATSTFSFDDGDCTLWQRPPWFSMTFTQLCPSFSTTVTHFSISHCFCHLTRVSCERLGLYNFKSQCLPVSVS